MKKKWIGICLAAAGCMVLLTACRDDAGRGPKDSGEVKTVSWNTPMEKDGRILLRLANNQKPDHPASEACDYFAQLVRERTDNRIQIQVYHSSVLGNEAENVKEVEYGSIDMARVSIALLTSYNQELLALQMPYLYKDEAHMWRVLNSGLGDKYLESMEEKGIEGLCWYGAGARNFYTSSREIRSPADLKDMRIRVQESSFMMDVIGTMGAIPVDMPYEDVREALKNGGIDGAENNFPSYASAGHYHEAPYMIMDEHVRIPEMVIMNRHVLEQLSQKDQDTIRQAAYESSLRQRELWTEYEREQWKMLEKAGVRILYPEDKTGFREMVRPVYDMYGQPYEDILSEIRQMGGPEA